MLDRMPIAAEAKAGWGAIKAHWLFFLVVFLIVGIGFLAWDYKKKGDATKMFAGWPLIGKLFACAALAIGFSKLTAVRLLLGFGA
jgi:type II secretory pathway component PulF